MISVLIAAAVGATIGVILSSCIRRLLPRAAPAPDPKREEAMKLEVRSRHLHEHVYRSDPHRPATLQDFDDAFGISRKEEPGSEEDGEEGDARTETSEREDT